MKRLFLLLLLIPWLLQGQGLVIDHLAVKEFDLIPAEYINLAKQRFNLNFCNSSHGEQIVIGMTRLKAQNSNLDFQVRDCSIIENPTIFSIYRGLLINGSCDNYIDHLEYWASDAGKQNVQNTLQLNPNLNLSTWTWCHQHRGDPNTYGNIQPYLDVLNQFEQGFPNIIFIYMTGHSGTYYGHHSDSPSDISYNNNGYYAYLNNEHIRQYCRDNNKILFDFGDIDCWWFNSATQKWECGYTLCTSSRCNGITFPREHDHYNIGQAGHTSFENCENKAKAFWVLLAKLAGWNGTGSDITPPDTIQNLHFGD